MASFAWKLKVSCGGHGLFLWKVSHPFTATTRTMTRTRPAPVMVASRSYFSSAPAVATGGVASHLHASTPWLTLPPEIDHATTTSRKVDRFYSMTDNQILKLDRKKSLKVPEEAWCFGSSRGWLSFIDPKDCSLYLCNPFHDSPLVRLPSIETLPSILGVKRNPSSNSMIDKFIIVPQCSESKTHYYVDPDWLSRLFYHLTLSCEPFNSKDGGDCVAMVVPSYQHAQLAFCRVGRDEYWTTIPGGYIFFGSSGTISSSLMKKKGGGGGDEDMMNLFYSMYSDWYGDGIDAWEIPKPWRFPARRANFMYRPKGTKLHEVFEFEAYERNLRNRCYQSDYLVADDESGSGDILLVIRHTARHVAEDGTIFDKEPYTRTNKVDPFLLNPPPIKKLAYKTLRFDVYKVDMKNQNLKRINYLDNRLIFLGLSQSFTLPASEFPSLKSNSIYFTDDWSDMVWSDAYPYGGHDLGIYNLDDNSIESCYPFPGELNKDKKILPSPLWVAPNRSF